MNNNQKPRGRVIVTYGRSLMALVIARSLAERGIEVIGCDDVELTVLQFTKHCTDYFVHPNIYEDTQSALDIFEEAVRQHAPADDIPYVLIPAFRDAKIFAEHRDRFEPLIKIAAPDLSSINAVHPKHKLVELASEHELTVPDTDVIRHGECDTAGLTWPRIAKPSDGVGGRGVEKVDDEAAFQSYLQHTNQNDIVLLQELIDGEDFCVSVAADHGRLTGAVAYRNLRQFPNENGAGAVRETVSTAPFLPDTEKLLRATNWHGVAEIDFRWNGSSDQPPVLIEVNPRFWAGLFHSTESGVDFPWLAFCQAAGLPVPEFSENQVDIGFQSKTAGAWLLSIAEETFAEDQAQKEAERLLKEAKASFQRSDRREALKLLGSSIKSRLHLASVRDELKAKHDDIVDLPTELSVDDDPLVGLGSLFAISSLVRHGKLPAELTFDEVASDEPSTADTKRPRNHERHKPRIGITKPSNGDWLAHQIMKLAIVLAGGEPSTITSKSPRDPQSIDGLLFGGGSDIFPRRYGGEERQGYRYDLARDDIEANWADTARKNNIPMLGICRGAQMMNVLRGGSLYPDLSAFEQNHPTSWIRRVFYRKRIVIEPGSVLARVVGHTKLQVNSIHSQAMNSVAEPFVVTASEKNGIVQAIENPSADFEVGLQFHPEFLIHRSFARNIFRAFVQSATTRLKAKKDR